MQLLSDQVPTTRPAPAVEAAFIIAVVEEKSVQDAWKYTFPTMAFVQAPDPRLVPTVIGVAVPEQDAPEYCIMVRVLPVKE